MWLQYPEGTEFVSSYIESRGGKWNETVFFGMQMFLKEYMMEPFTQEDILEADKMWTQHGEPFNREGFQYILDNHDGYFPVKIESLAEGTVIPTRNALVQIQNTDPKVPWVTTWIETALLRAIWYPTTVATNSYKCKEQIHNALVKTGSPDQIAFKLHDFGARGVSSQESAMIGGASHLVNFMGTDTMAGIAMIKEYYDEDMAGFSIPASEHSTITTWGGPEFEIDAFENMLDKFGGEGKIVACVSDSYNIWESVEKWKSLEPKILEKKMTLVVRPDSGDPTIVPIQLIQMLMDAFGSTTNDKGYKVLPDHIRIIQGDGITHDSIGQILKNMISNGLSVDNIAFGMGGGMLQQFDRDTLKFAMKASAIKVNGQWRDVYKDPVTDHGKGSKRGRLKTVRTDFGTWETTRVYEADLDTSDETKYPYGNKLKLRYRNGYLRNQTSFARIRELASKGFENV